MRSRPLRALAVGAAFLAVPLGALAPGCGSDANGIDTCRQIESARCALAPVCAAFATQLSGTDGLPVVVTSSDVTHCQEFYRDQCLNGLENTAANPTQDQIGDCINALTATAACASAPNFDGCKGTAIVGDAGGADVPCRVLLYNPQVLTACAFVAIPDASAPDATDDGDAGDGAAE